MNKQDQRRVVKDEQRQLLISARRPSMPDSFEPKPPAIRAATKEIVRLRRIVTTHNNRRQRMWDTVVRRMKADLSAINRACAFEEPKVALRKIDAFKKKHRKLLRDD